MTFSQGFATWFGGTRDDNFIPVISGFQAMPDALSNFASSPAYALGVFAPVIVLALFMAVYK